MTYPEGFELPEHENSDIRKIWQKK